MDILNNLGDYIAIALSIVGGISLVVKGVAVFTGITPGTRDDEIVSQVQSGVKKLQKFLGTLAADTSKNVSKAS